MSTAEAPDIHLKGISSKEASWAWYKNNNNYYYLIIIITTIIIIIINIHLYLSTNEWKALPLKINLIKTTPILSLSLSRMHVHTALKW